MAVVVNYPAAGGGVPLFSVPFSQLPPAAASLGVRGYVTDSLLPAFGAVVAGGGAVFAPVYSNGTSWLVG